MGRKGGRPKALDAKRRARTVELYREGNLSVDEICRTQGISRGTLYAYVNEQQAGSTTDE